jgi:hypothetical protein
VVSANPRAFEERVSSDYGHVKRQHQGTTEALC